ncbi:hypothetical protein N658DRAFT_491173 [Parathielavia hyrcaniae]|uniref:Uncharacterized protein n=1 Tax=Parathielavia hyrcaniae TaxID=113614 RepID=A0AAN6QAE3_9PEZI|nr:hypothetical protein N658DRAFT_491173 [Parathielavia hyrcaniae]
MKKLRGALPDDPSRSLIYAPSCYKGRSHVEHLTPPGSAGDRHSAANLRFVPSLGPPAFNVSSAHRSPSIQLSLSRAFYPRGSTGHGRSTPWPKPSNMTLRGQRHGPCSFTCPLYSPHSSVKLWPSPVGAGETPADQAASTDDVFVYFANLNGECRGFP